MAGKKRAGRRNVQQGIICEGMSFAASEAYKLLRTNLLFSLPEKHCHIIGVTSSVRGEGKSTTAVNLSYTIAQSGKRVLLIDADMRLPSVAIKLDLKGAPGLACASRTKWRTGTSSLPATSRPTPRSCWGLRRCTPCCSIMKRSSMSSSSTSRLSTLWRMRWSSPIISKWADGLICVVRQNYTDRRALSDCMYQIQKLGSHFLGFVMTDAVVGETGYKSYGKYGKKYGYGYGYGYGYESADSGKSSQKAEAKRQAFLDATTDEAPPADETAEAEEEKPADA